MALNALVDSFLPQSEKNVGVKGLTRLICMCNNYDKMTCYWRRLFVTAGDMMIST